MKQLVKHIELLLTRHDCVIVPGLGGFITHKESAKLIGHRLFPPTTTISFNSLLTHSDGLLAESIMQCERVDYKTALQTISHCVSLLHEELNKQGWIELGKIGRLSQNEQRTLFFAPSIAEFLPDNYGLRPVYLTPLVNEEKVTAITIPLPQHGSQVWRYAAAIVLLGVLTLFAPKNSVEEYHKASLNFTLPTSFEKAVETIVEVPAPEVLSEMIPDTTPQAVAPSTPIAKAAPLRYHLIIASMPSYEAAIEYCNEKSTAAEPLTIISAEGKHRIASKSFTNNTDAFAYLDSVRSNNETKKAWILKATL